MLKKKLFYILICMHGGLMSAVLCGFLPWYAREDLTLILTLQVLITLPLLVLALYFLQIVLLFFRQGVLILQIGLYH